MSCQEAVGLKTAGNKRRLEKIEMKKKMLVLVIIAVVALLLGYFVSMPILKGL